MGVYATWTEEDKKYLKEYYIKYGVKQAAEMLGRTYAATREQVKRLGYNDPNIIKTWRYDELEYLKRVYPKYGPTRVSNRLGRSYKAVQAKAYKLGLSYYDTSRQFPTWTEWQLNYLKKNFSSMTNKNIAKNIRKTPEAVRDTARRLGLKKNKPNLWSQEEEELLLKMVKSFKIQTICRAVKKPRQTVINKMRELNLKTEDDDDRLRPSEVADILDISAQTVRNYCAQNYKVSDYEKFHGKKYYKMTVPQVLRFMVNKIDLWIDRNYNVSYIGLFFLDLYSSFYCKNEISIIKSRIEEQRGCIKWPEHVRMKGARDENVKNKADKDACNNFELDLFDELFDEWHSGWSNDFYLDYEDESVI